MTITKTTARAFAGELHALLFPEDHPPGTEFHDKDHVYWQDADDIVTEIGLMRLTDMQLMDGFEAREYGDENGVTWVLTDFWKETDHPPALTPGQRQALIEKWLADQATDVEEREPFQWSADTIEWVAEAVADEYNRSK